MTDDQLDSSAAADSWQLDASAQQPSSTGRAARCTAAVGAMVSAWAAQQPPLHRASSVDSGAAAAARDPPMQPGAVLLPVALSHVVPAPAVPLAALQPPQRRLQRPEGEVSSIVLATRLRLARPRPVRRIIPGTRA